MNSLYHPGNKKGLFHKHVFISQNNKTVEGGNLRMIPTIAIPDSVLNLTGLDLGKTNFTPIIRNIKPLSKGGFIKSPLKGGAIKRENIRMIF